MTSPAQACANRRNARLSSGPRSPEGRRRSAMNALAHGVTAQAAVLPGEDAAAFERLKADLYGRAMPVGELERRCVDRLALLYAALERAGRADAAAWNACWQEDVWPKRPVFGPAPGGLDHFAIGLSAAIRGGALKQLSLLSLYESRLRRACEKAWAELGRLQQARRLALVRAAETDAEALRRRREEERLEAQALLDAADEAEAALAPEPEAALATAPAPEDEPEPPAAAPAAGRPPLANEQGWALCASEVRLQSALLNAEAAELRAAFSPSRREQAALLRQAQIAEIATPTAA